MQSITFHLVAVAKTYTKFDKTKVGHLALRFWRYLNGISNLEMLNDYLRFEDWKKLETIELSFFAQEAAVAAYILCGADLTQLKSINIKLRPEMVATLNMEIHNNINELTWNVGMLMVKGISKSPSTLTDLSLEGVALDLAAMEVIHGGAPNL